MWAMRGNPFHSPVPLPTPQLIGNIVNDPGHHHTPNFEIISNGV